MSQLIKIDSNYANLSRDLAEVLPNEKSFFETNLKYMKYFYQLYNQISPQLVDELCKIPWGHHHYIIDKRVKRCLGK